MSVASTLLGEVYFLPNRLVGFVEPHKPKHPAACVQLSKKAQATFLPGTSDRRSADRGFLVHPDNRNGLHIATVFLFNPKHFRVEEALRWAAQGSRIGKLTSDKLDEIARQMAKYFSRERRRRKHKRQA